MTALSVAQTAVRRVVGRNINGLFQNTETIALEMADLINEAATDIARWYEWERLLRLCKITGDGVTIEHALPADYDRMPVKQDVHPSSWTLWRYTPARDLDQWLDFLNGLPTVQPGFWIIIDGKMGIFPPAQTGDSANFYYISKNIWRSAGAVPKPKATEDTDEFLLDERILTLGLIWRWRAQKGLEYSEDMRNYEIALSQEVARDKGSHIVRGGGRLGARWNAGGRFAYPLPLSGN